MKTALIFPGQGSQYIGMGKDFYSKYEASRLIMDNLDEALGRKISKDIFSGDESEIVKTQNAQPAIMATSISIFNALITEKLLPVNSFQCVAGHSLGEYSALVANKSLKFSDSVKLLKVRSKAMQDSMPIGSGGMIAVLGSSNENITNAISKAGQFGKIFIANDNAEGQIVLSGEINAIDFILSNSKDLGIRKAVKLSVSAPFHCELIHKASEIMKLEISNYKFELFSVPLYSNVTSEICNENDIADLLIKQITSKVRWREIIENMISNKVKNFIEIGPSNVLTGLVKRISKEVNSISISKLEDLDKLDKMVS